MIYWAFLACFSEYLVQLFVNLVCLARVEGLGFLRVDVLCVESKKKRGSGELR